MMPSARLLILLTFALAAGAAAAQGTAYVSSEKDDALTMIDAQTLAVKGTVPTCKRGRHIQRLPDGKLMVACTDSNAADVIDPASGKSVRRVPLGEEPEAFDVSPDGKTIYVADTEGARLWAFDIEAPGVLRKPSPDHREAIETCIERTLKARGVSMTVEADETTQGPAHFVVTDPDGKAQVLTLTDKSPGRMVAAWPNGMTPPASRRYGKAGRTLTN